ncbi:hypothetical protein ASG43_10890 [Aureimonas sp. Leaf454]|uniref:HAMP domain-containing methyl-accepting chemotaxis protein n=1 Tax=Aureimonas sp. Leaf454 TaxID=1736381 RepID=UPI00070183C2|nr:methyl-accepting chemotaxis protein [Aureimonas sp. Leaf454]KQT47575.1 hypothetical protein ASG43_10890 [Aureimonas sp. Leaf454]
MVDAQQNGLLELSMSFSDLKINRKLIVTFSTILLTVLTMTGFVGYNLSGIQTASGWDRHTTTVLAQADAAREAFVEQVAAVRGFTISPTPLYRTAFEAASHDFETAIETIARLTSDNATQQVRVAKLKTDGAEYAANVADVQMGLASDPATRQRALQMVIDGVTAPRVQAVKDDVATIRAAEQDLLTTRRADADAAFQTTFLVLGAGSAITLLLAAAMGGLLSKAVARPVVAMTEVMRRLSAGDTSVVIPGVGRGDELGAMAAAVESFREAALEKDRQDSMNADERRSAETTRRSAEQRATTAAREAFVAAIRPSFEQLSNGDLTARLDPARNADYVEVCDLFNRSVESLESTIGAVVLAVGTMKTGLGEITVAANDLSQRTEQQAASLEETVAALAEVTRGINVTAQDAAKAQTAAATARKNAEKGGEIVGRAVTAMGAIEQSSEQIGKIIGVIDEIAFQTNLLALNAGVEAARAGEAGRGFAVVAQEVRGLAQRSAEAAKEIKTLISASSAQVRDGVELVTASGRSLEEIQARVGEMSDVVAQIAQSAGEQASSLREVSVAADQMDKVTQQNAAMVEETTAAAETLSGETAELAAMVGQFRTSLAQRPLADTRPAAPKRRAAPVLQMRASGRGGAAAKPAPVDAEWSEF